jgi:hypothetical protein
LTVPSGTPSTSAISGDDRSSVGVERPQRGPQLLVAQRRVEQEWLCGLVLGAETPPLPQQIEHAVNRDPHQPRLERPPPIEARQRCRRPQERVLGGVVRQLPITADPIRGPPDARPVSIKQCAQRLPIPPLRGEN